METNPSFASCPLACTATFVVCAGSIGAATLYRMADVAEEAWTLPAPPLDEKSTAKAETAVFAGGCFWGVQGVFQHVKGVTNATSGYAGGAENTAQYATVSSGTTGHAEAVKVDYDPSQVTYGQPLKVYFSVAHKLTILIADPKGEQR